MNYINATPAIDSFQLREANHHALLTEMHLYSIGVRSGVIGNDLRLCDQNSSFKDADLHTVNFSRMMRERLIEALSRGTKQSPGMEMFRRFLQCSCDLSIAVQACNFAYWEDRLEYGGKQRQRRFSKRYKSVLSKLEEASALYKQSQADLLEFLKEEKDEFARCGLWLLRLIQSVEANNARVVARSAETTPFWGDFGPRRSKPLSGQTLSMVRKLKRY